MPTKEYISRGIFKLQYLNYTIIYLSYTIKTRKYVAEDKLHDMSDTIV